jgi:hypothetical protein
VRERAGEPPRYQGRRRYIPPYPFRWEEASIRHVTPPRPSHCHTVHPHSPRYLHTDMDTCIPSTRQQKKACRVFTPIIPPALSVLPDEQGCIMYGGCRVEHAIQEDRDSARRISESEHPSGLRRLSFRALGAVEIVEHHVAVFQTPSHLGRVSRVPPMEQVHREASVIKRCEVPIDR